MRNRSRRTQGATSSCNVTLPGFEHLEKMLVLHVTALHAEGQQRPSQPQGNARTQGHTGAFAGREHVEWIFLLIEDKALHPLAHADACLARDTDR